MAKILGAHIPLEPKNLAINGAFDYFQRTTSTTINTASTISGSYVADMFAYSSGGSTTKNYSLSKSTTVPTDLQSGFASTNSILFTMITGIGSFAAGDWINPCQYRMEGLDVARIIGKNVTFGFWAYASIAGTYTFSIRNNSGTNRSYVTTFSIASANTWQFISITAPIDSSATTTWNVDNNNSMYVDIGSYSGSTFQTSTLGSWQTGNFFVASVATAYMATTGATLQVAQFSIIEGSLGFGATGFLRAGKDIQQELALCQRYYETGNGYVENDFSTGGNTSRFGSTSFYKVTKRTTPTVTSTANAGTGITSFDGPNGIMNTQDSFSHSAIGNASTSSTTRYYTIAWASEAGL